MVDRAIRPPLLLLRLPFGKARAQLAALFRITGVKALREDPIEDRQRQERARNLDQGQPVSMPARGLRSGSLR
jgi:hypothetical protein